MSETTSQMLAVIPACTLAPSLGPSQFDFAKYRTWNTDSLRLLRLVKFEPDT